MPERKSATVDECLQRFPLVKEVFVDGAERPIRRPTGHDAQRPYSSGKKKGHRVKHVLVTTADRRIRVLSDTFSGHIHDKTGATDHGIFSPIPNEVLVHIDLGFLGIPKDDPRRLQPPRKETERSPVIG